MSTRLRNDSENGTHDIPRLIDALRQALDVNWARLLETAQKEWDRNLAGKDPSDACVSVRVSSGDSRKLPPPCAGVLRRRGRSLLSISGRPSLA